MKCEMDVYESNLRVWRRWNIYFYHPCFLFGQRNYGFCQELFSFVSVNLFVFSAKIFVCQQIYLFLSTNFSLFCHLFYSFFDHLIFFATNFK